jgi:hypothetical protein
MSWDDTLPIPICKRNDKEFECLCKGCKQGSDHLHCWTWHFCDVCNQKIWFNSSSCTLYAWRLSKGIICFNCRIPYYKKGLTTGEIYKIARGKST